jgi:hypothetical protein
MNLYNEASAIAEEAHAAFGGDFDAAYEFIHQSCDGHEVAIYYGKAIDFCATHDTDAGEEYLEGCGGIAQFGDTFGAIACRIAYATLYCACLEELHELQSEAENEAA